ncbi:GFA family protein [Candidatus Enterococcus moelleringii]|nr:GFA family protein [Enterococcus sp. 669A]
MMQLNGACLCGNVQITIPEIVEEITVCHCQMCQKFFGSSFLSLPGLSAEQFALQGAEFVQRYASSQWAERGFCKNCGSSLFYHALGQDYFFPTGLFEGVTGKIVQEIFYDKKPEFYQLQNDAPKLSEKEFLAHLFEGK